MDRAPTAACGNPCQVLIIVNLAGRGLQGPPFTWWNRLLPLLTAQAKNARIRVLA